VKSSDSHDLLFIVTLTDHRQLGPVLVPCLAESHSPCLEVETVLRVKDMETQAYVFNAREKEIIRLTSKITRTNLLTRFSRNGTADEFFSIRNEDFLKKQVIPYVEKQSFAVVRLLMGSGIPLYRKESKYSRLYEEDLILVPEEYATAGFDFRRDGRGTEYRLKIWQEEREIKIRDRNLQVISNDPAIFLLGNQLHIFENIGFKKINPFLSREAISISPEMEEKYYRNFITGIIAEHKVTATGFTLTDVRKAPVPVLSLENNLEGTPVFALRFRYPGKEFLWPERKQRFVTVDFSGGDYRFDRIQRDLEMEEGTIRLLVTLGLEEKSGTFGLPNLRLLESQESVYHIVSWLTRHRARLESAGFEIRQSAFPKQYFTGSAEVKFDVREKSDWFDVYGVVIFGDFRIPFLKLRKYILNYIREFQLPDGQTAILPEEWFERYRILYPFVKGDGYAMTFQRHHAHLLPAGTLPGSSAWLEALYQDFDLLPQVSVPEELKADLRSYQLTGFRWMHALFKNNLGGCLADDMGLGKTVQAIAYLLKIRKLTKRLPGKTPSMDGQLSLFAEPEAGSSQPASLVVMPTSLVYNWESELARFAPCLKVYRHTGPQRIAAWQNHSPAELCDVILTTYGTVRNDMDFLKETEFFSLILDESQLIKNHLSKTYKAVIELKAKHRLVLTGTPIENSLTDLWSQMNFINRGMLGSYAFFRQNFLLPVENKQEEKVTAKLQLMVKPFILRRTKEEVASDLPPKMEQVIYCPMVPDQESEYEREKSIIRNAILVSIENKGIRQSTLAIITGLTKLRQLANHPRLLHPESKMESGKFFEIIRLLGNVVAENHKVLVFSSFVTHLELVREELEKEKWKYSLLTGASRNRKEIIQQFQEDPDNHIFLISLKAGGLGLNLTSAGYVFLLDPWWNPASENQAIDRAHRIGQEKHVFVYRFITENTVEEKIERLKERKSNLAELVINRNDPFGAFSEEEIWSMF